MQGNHCAFLFFLAFALSACRTTPSPKTPAKPQDKPLSDPVRLEPFVIRALPDPRDNTQMAIDAYDAGDLFGRASTAYREEIYKEAAKRFVQVADEFPNSEYAPPALYNAALAMERQNDFQNAATLYERLISSYPDAADITDALFRLTRAFEALEMWAEADQSLDKLLTERSDLESIERVECLARKGATLIHLDNPLDAKENLLKAVALFRNGSDISPTAPTYFYAMARFKLGEIIEADMHNVVLPSDEAAMSEALEKKCQLLLDAQSAYTEAIRVAHPHWAAAAAYRIGHLYRILWGDMMTSPAPEDLNPEEKEIYYEVLRKRIRVLLKKAIRQWERVLAMADRLALNNEWVVRTKSDLEDIRALLTMDNTSKDDDDPSEAKKTPTNQTQ